MQISNGLYLNHKISQHKLWLNEKIFSHKILSQNYPCQCFASDIYIDLRLQKNVTPQTQD